jgi:molybdopterin converting factor small subunit
VLVRLPTVLRPYAGGETTVQADGATVGEVLGDLTDRFPGIKGQVMADEGKLNRFVNVYLNDEDVRYLDQLDTKVHDRDVLSILPAVAGGGVGPLAAPPWALGRELSRARSGHRPASAG